MLRSACVHTQSHLIVCDPINYIGVLPGSAVHGIFQARILEQGIYPTQGDIESASPALAGRFFTTEPPGKPVEICLRHKQVFKSLFHSALVPSPRGRARLCSLEKGGEKLCGCTSQKQGGFSESAVILAFPISTRLMSSALQTGGRLGDSSQGNLTGPGRQSKRKILISGGGGAPNKFHSLIISSPSPHLCMLTFLKISAPHKEGLAGTQGSALM